MKKAFFNKIIYGIILFYTSIIHVSAQEYINVLNSDYYGFEVASGNNGWWMQQPNNLSIETNKGANGSSRCLKYTNTTTYTGSKKAFGSTTIADMLIDLEVGVYDVKAMVWVEAGANISNIKVNFRTSGLSDVNAVFNLSTINTDQWVEVSTQLNLTHNFKDTNVRIMMDSSYGGIGTMYFDDLQILVKAPPAIEKIPASSQISTSGTENLTLDKGRYAMSLKVWVDQEATIQNFYTYIVEPWVASRWNIDDIAKNEWVTLKTEIVLEDDAIDSEFRIKVNNNPDYGGGKGRFYIDDIYLVKIKESYEENDNFTIQTIGETCQGENNGIIKINANYTQDYKVDIDGVSYNFSNTLSIENLEPNTYNLCISVNNTNFKTCYALVIEEGRSISGKILNTKANTISVSIDQGTAPYIVNINDTEILRTNAQNFNVKTISGGVLKVQSSKSCEGLLVEHIEINNDVKVYPNPVSQTLIIETPKSSSIEIFNVLGKAVFFKQNAPNYYKIPVSLIVPGVYIVKVVTAEKMFSKKIIVR
ncbi:hypothetical protein GCM10022291_25900 [Postechiella marina]|uniref:Secretion system C-terminal sorting domain-containing protein n=1 Tax=Postechiella marina TaxID=943941 RepID=A0ABP8CDF4_9FLAO